MFINIVKNSILGNKTQKILSFSTIFLATLLLSCMLNITLGVGNELGKELRNYGANIVVLPQGASLNIEVGDKSIKPFANKSYLELKDLYKIKEIFWRNNIAAFAPFKEENAVFSSKEIALLGTYFDKNIPIDGESDYHTGFINLYPVWQIDGRWVDDLSKDYEVNMSKELAQNLNLQLNDTFSVSVNNKEIPMKLVGIIKNASEYQNKILINIDNLNNILNQDGSYERAQVSALTIPESDLSQRARKDKDSLNSLEYDKWYCTAYVSSIAFQIEENYAGASAKALSKVADAESSIVKKIQSLMSLIFIICLIVASVAMASLINSDVFRRQKEIGLLKALGANNFQIYLIFAIDCLIVSLIASIFGSTFGFFLSDLIALKIFSHTINYNFIIYPICMLIAAIISLLGALLATKNYANMQIVEVLYGRK